MSRSKIDSPVSPSLIGFLVLTLGGGLVLGYLTAPGPWYQQLAKPPFNPPDWLFAPVWTVLYVLIAIAGWRVYRREPDGAAMKLWWLQLALNFGWTPVFFGLNRLGFALLVILLLVAAIVSFIISTWRPDRTAAWLFVPYLAWVAFATLLNAALWLLN